MNKHSAPYIQLGKCLNKIKIFEVFNQSFRFTCNVELDERIHIVRHYGNRARIDIVSISFRLMPMANIHVRHSRPRVFRRLIFVSTNYFLDFHRIHRHYHHTDSRLASKYYLCHHHYYLQQR